MMSDTPVSPKNRRSKRRAAIEAASKIKKIVDDDIHYEHKSHTLDGEAVNVNKDERKKKCTTTTQTQKSLFFNYQNADPSPSLSISNSPLSFASLSSIPEEFCLSDSTNIGSIMTSSSFNGDQTISINEEIDREWRRRQRLINSTGTMYLSEKTGYRISLHSPQKSPVRATKLTFTPFACFPTTPIHVYQYRAPVTTTSHAITSSARRNHSAVGRRVRASGRGKGRVIEPRQLM
jgi:hypothetical protein